MKISSWILFLAFASVVFVASCSSIEPMSKEEVEMNQEIKKLRYSYAEAFKDKEAVFEGIKVYRESTVVGKKKQIHSMSYYYIDTSGKKINHGLTRFYRDNEVIMEGMSSNGTPNHYMMYKIPNKTLQVIFKDGKPETGTYPVGLHNGEVLGIDLKNGMPLKATLYAEDGTVKEIVFDVSKNETRNSQPWNGEFLSMGTKKIEKYSEGKLVSTTDCESLDLIEEILGTFKKNKPAVDVSKIPDPQKTDNK
ncbi:MAG: hypothetical protein WCV79_04475 [Candidatus Paceibacterota bacterium]